ncbi:MAG TPA: substrate-binding domain-containing protein, partial [Burkholderiaceae bacterium]|nr:substrate-binding domain-containing protein [Burkholderiaceae bacterium]
LASGALLEAAARGVAVPQRLALLGFGDFPIGRQMEPALSTVRPPRYEIGHEAGRMLVQAMAARATPSDLALPWTLIERASTRAAAQS